MQMCYLRQGHAAFCRFDSSRYSFVCTRCFIEQSVSSGPGIVLYIHNHHSYSDVTKVRAWTKYRGEKTSVL